MFGWLTPAQSFASRSTRSSTSAMSAAPAWYLTALMAYSWPSTRCLHFQTSPKAPRPSSSSRSKSCSKRRLAPSRLSGSKMADAPWVIAASPLDASVSAALLFGVTGTSWVEGLPAATSGAGTRTGPWRRAMGSCAASAPTSPVPPRAISMSTSCVRMPHCSSSITVEDRSETLIGTWRRSRRMTCCRATSTPCPSLASGFSRRKLSPRPLAAHARSNGAMQALHLPSRPLCWVSF
mmetsp:Transcript_64483/g.189090  ORF Transcript_64483/g.189090 Transcript_64483/m.189090 type:complete len:236 (+) Transcript_64483:304-1011(+)